MDNIKSFIEQQLAVWNVPGCAVVAVKDGKAILNAGFGLRDIEAKLPVTTETLFQIASTTKAFTAAAIGDMVDVGLVEWDKPVRNYLPDFKMHDPVATERVTLRDLLCHRTGLARHDHSAGVHPERSRTDLVRRLRHLPLSKDIRQEFHYCSLGYTVAGYLIEIVTGRTWEEFVSTRLLKPLGMDHSNVSLDDSRRSGNFAKPYEFRQGKVTEMTFRDCPGGRPAGGINSCTDDMLQWLLVNLHAGRLGDDQVISPATMGEMQRIQMPFAEDKTFPEATWSGYGLGWMIGQYRGRHLVEHGGGIDGSLTECMLLPNDGFGVLVLTNSSSGQMGRVLAFRVLDDLLKMEPIDWCARFTKRQAANAAKAKEARAARPRVEGGKLPRPIEDYVGEYSHPGYGTLSITKENGKLTPRFGTMKLALTHRHFDIFDLEWWEWAQDFNLFPLTFLTAPEGNIMALTVPFESMAAPIHFERQQAD